MDIWNDFCQNPNESELKKLVLEIQKFMRSSRKCKQYSGDNYSVSIKFDKKWCFTCFIDDKLSDEQFE